MHRITLFKMKKILLVLFSAILLAAGTLVFAVDQATTTTPKIDSACMKSAIDKRDTALISAFDTYQVSIKAALSTRQSALKAAWDITDKQARNKALKAAWQNYKTAVQAAKKVFKNAKQASWQQFSKDRKDCKISLQEDFTNSSIDGNL